MPAGPRRHGQTHNTVIWVLSIAFWWWMISDCLGNQALTGIQRMTWLAVVVCLPGVGALLYLLSAKGGTGSRPKV